MTPSYIGICAASAHLPGAPVDIVPWAAARGVAPELVSELLVNKCRHFHEATGESDLELIDAALTKLDGPTGWRRGVRYLIHAHTQAFSIPAPPESILAALCLRHGFALSMAFSVTQLACASLVSALDAGVRCLEADPGARFALVVTSDRVFGGPQFRIRGNACVQSDGASAILLGRSGLRCRLGRTSFVNFTKLHEGPSTPLNAATMGHFLGRHTVALLRGHETATGRPTQSFDEILPTNADYPAWQEAMKAMALDEKQLFVANMAAHGHACCADLAVNLVSRGFAQLEAGRELLAAGTSNIGAFAAVSLHPAGREE